MRNNTGLAFNGYATLSRVLIVEDEPALLALLDVALRDIGGLDALTCTSCAEALERAGAFVPDLMVIDVQLADGDGLDLVAKLRSLTTLSNVPAVLLTARPEVAADRAAGNGAIAGVLAKPFAPMTLAATLETLWQDWGKGQHV